eukprot:SAG22_NODE_9150_length_607_cov_1.007874_1_plen_28_part_10
MYDMFLFDYMFAAVCEHKPTACMMLEAM